MRPARDNKNADRLHDGGCPPFTLYLQSLVQRARLRDKEVTIDVTMTKEPMIESVEPMQFITPFSRPFAWPVMLSRKHAGVMEQKVPSTGRSVGEGQ